MMFMLDDICAAMIARTIGCQKLVRTRVDPLPPWHPEYAQLRLYYLDKNGHRVLTESQSEAALTVLVILRQSDLTPQEEQ